MVPQKIVVIELTLYQGIFECQSCAVFVINCKYHTYAWAEITTI